MKNENVGMISLIALIMMLSPLMVPLYSDASTSTDGRNLDGSLIVKPKVGYLYVHDREVVALGGRITVIIGQITITAQTQRDVQLDRVEFWINREVKNSDPRPPYEWTWNEKTVGWNTLKVIAYKGDRSSSDDMTAFVYNVGRMTE